MDTKQTKLSYFSASSLNNSSLSPSPTITICYSSNNNANLGSSQWLLSSHHHGNMIFWQDYLLLLPWWDNGYISPSAHSRWYSISRIGQKFHFEFAIVCKEVISVSKRVILVIGNHKNGIVPSHDFRAALNSLKKIASSIRGTVKLFLHDFSSRLLLGSHPAFVA